MANSGLTNAIRDVLAEAEDSLTVRQIADAVADAGLTVADHSVRALLRQREIAGEFIKAEIGGQVCYALSPEFVSNLNAGKPRIEGPSAWNLIQQALEDEPAPVRAGDLIDRAVSLSNHGHSRESFRKAISTAFAEGRMVRHGSHPSYSYALADEGRNATPAEDATCGGDDASPDAALPAGAPLAALGVSMAPAVRPIPALVIRPVPADAASIEALRLAGIGDVEPSAHAPRQAPPLAVLGLRERLEAVATDLEDALGDACDFEIQHEVIKAIALATGATQRALRKLAA